MTFGLCSLSESLVTTVILDGKSPWSSSSHDCHQRVTFVKRNVCNYRGGMAGWEPIITNTSDIRRTAETCVPSIGDNHFWNLCPPGPVFYTFGDLCEMSASVPLQSSLLVAFALPHTPGSCAKRTQGISSAASICFVLILPWHVK